MLISFIIPVYNAENFIEKCVHSILDQPIDKDSFEIILVNDGSKDSSNEICTKLQEDYHPVKYFIKENAGPGHTRNYGLDRATGDYIWFIDADDFLEPGVVGEMLPHLDEGHDLYIFGYKALDLQGNETRREKHKIALLSPVTLLKMGHYVNTVWVKLIKKSILDQHNIRFREDIRGPEDFHFSFRLMAAIDKIKTLDSIAYNYIENPASLMNTRSEAHMHKLGDDSITAVNDLRPILADMDMERHVAFDSWLANFVYGLLFSFARFSYSRNYVAKSLDRLKENDNYPLTLGAANWKRRIFTGIANRPYLFLRIIGIKRSTGK